MEMERVDFREALKRLADQAGVALPERDERQPSLANRLYQINESAARLFHEALSSHAGERARSYLRGRRFGEDAARIFQLGYALEGREHLVQHLRASGFEDRLMLAAGLALQDEADGKVRDRFRGRLMFPIRDASKRIVGFGGRILGEGQPKYLNSPQTEIFDKSSVLFGIHLAQDAIRQTKRAVLVEGYLDAVRAHLAGFSNVVASLGTAVTVTQLRALHRLTSDVILALDPDEAGQLAAARAGLNALAELRQVGGRSGGASQTLDLRIATLPPGRGDPDEMIRDHPALWEEALAHSLPAFDFFTVQTLRSLDRADPSWRQQALEQLLPVLQKLAGNADGQRTMLQRLSRETGISTQLLVSSLPRVRTGARAARPRSGQDQLRASVADVTSRSLAADPAVGIEAALLALLLKLVAVPPSVASILEKTPLERTQHQAILSHLNAWSTNGNYEYELFRETLPVELRQEADEIRGRNVPLPEDDRLELVVSFHATRLRQFRLEAQLELAQQLLAEPENEASVELRAEAARLQLEMCEVQEALEQLSIQISRSRSAI
jgi:DNA primase